MDVTTVIINFQTPDLLKTAVQSFKKHYPEVPLWILDNGSKDDSPELIKRLEETLPYTNGYFIEKNIYHGPAMDFAIRNLIETPCVFLLDSDTEVLKPGFLEQMEQISSGEKIYGSGEIIRVNDRGFKSDKGIEILSTPYMFIKTGVYKTLPPFIHHGQPTLNNFNEAILQGFGLVQFPVADYIFHHWRGTANRFGYGLGLKGKVDYFLNKLGL